MRLIAVSTEHGIAFWQIGSDVFRAPLGAALDTVGHPMGKRWEASIAHWQRFRSSVFGWAKDA